MSWEYATHEDYKEVSPNENWLACPKCGVIPRVWRFDNGCSVKCLCFHKYDAGLVRAESINSCYSREKSAMNYNRDTLRRNWNHYIETGEVIQLEPGQW